MEQALTIDHFVRAPVGKWIAAGSTVAWCHSPTLCGAYCWGRPDGESARTALRAYQAYRQMAPSFDAIIDGSAIEAVLPEAIYAVVEWVRAEADQLSRRIRRQVGVIPHGVDGLTLAGVAPQLGHPYPVQILTDARDAFRLLAPEVGDALAGEVASIASAIRGTPPILTRLRGLLRAREARLTLAAAASELGISERQLQRELALAGRSFRAELLDARFECLTRILSLSDDKLASVAAHLGITKTSLAALVRERTGRRPADYRADLRSKR